MGDVSRQGRAAVPDADGAAQAAASQDTPEPRRGRAALLRLATWFDSADEDTAHRLYTAAFAMGGARNLGGVGDSSHALPSGVTSWWHAPGVVNTARFRAATASAAPVDDHSAQQARLRDAAEAAAHWRRSAAQEVRRILAEGPEEPSGDDGDGTVRLSNAALGILMELLAAALGTSEPTSGTVSAGDLELDLRLHVTRSSQCDTALRAPDGDLKLEGLSLRATGYGTTAIAVPAAPSSEQDRLSGDERGTADHHTGSEPEPLPDGDRADE